MPKKPVPLPQGVYEKTKGSGVYYVRVKQGVKDHRQRVGTSVVEAEKRYRLLKREVEEGFAQAPRPSKTTFLQMGEDAIQWYKDQGRKDLRTFTGRMNAVTGSFLGEMSAQAINFEHIERYINSLACTPATKNRYRTTISKAFSLAVKRRVVSDNPARLVERKAEHNERVRFLSDDEEKRLMVAIQQRCPSQLPALIFALMTGARRGEQFRIRWSDVDLSLKQVVFRNTKNGRTRYVQLNKTLLAALRTVKRSETNDFVFQAQRGDAPIQDPTKWFTGALGQANVTDFTWHDLRHTFISRLIMKGVPPGVVSKIAGHSDLKMTARYAHLSPAVQQEAVNALDPEESAAIELVADSLVPADPSSKDEPLRRKGLKLVPRVSSH